MGVNLQLAGGTVLLEDYASDGVTLGNQYYPGTTDLFSFSTEADGIEHINTESEPPFSPDGEDPKSLKEMLKFTTKDINNTFTAMAMLASTSTFTQTAQTDTAVTISSALAGKVEDVGYFDITAFVVKDSTDTTTYVSGTDYTYDKKWGTFIVLDTGDIADADEIHIVLSANAITEGTDYVANDVDKKEYKLTYQGRSSKGLNERHIWTKVSIVMSGERVLKSVDGEYTEYSFDATALTFGGTNHAVKTF